MYLCRHLTYRYSFHIWGKACDLWLFEHGLLCLQWSSSVPSTFLQTTFHSYGWIKFHCVWIPWCNPFISHGTSGFFWLFILLNIIQSEPCDSRTGIGQDHTLTPAWIFFPLFLKCELSNVSLLWSYHCQDESSAEIISVFFQYLVMKDINTFLV
jgi:hypothetical protein